MTAFLQLHDGRSLHGSSVGMAGMYKTIADQIGEPFTDLRNWLRDVADRPAPFMDFDIRGLTPQHRNEFFRAAASGMQSLIATHSRETLERSHAFGCLSRLLRMQEAVEQGEPPEAFTDLDTIKEFDGKPIDLSQLWTE